MKRPVFMIMFMAAAVFFAAEAQAVVEIDARYWFTNLSSDVKVTESGLPGTGIDLADDLGVDDSKGFPEGRVRLGFGDHHVRYSYMPMSWDGDEIITQSVNFDGKTYLAGTRVKSDFDVAYHRLGYEYDIVNTLGNKFGVIAEVKYFDIDASLKSPVNNESKSLAVPLPAIGVSVQAGLPAFLSVGAEITGMTAGNAGNLVDAEAFLNLTPAPLVTISAGYRYLALHAEHDDDEVDFKVSGPFATVRVGF
ncbi:MAG TPA: hypothetical protein VFF54_07005 [Thermodesulfobacteriota bacterium]|nr:hypothetical protein [Thermodesulfobacteriota bacterium]